MSKRKPSSSPNASPSRGYSTPLWRKTTPEPKPYAAAYIHSTEYKGPCDPQTRASDLKEYLSNIVPPRSSPTKMPYIHPKPISFRNAEQRANWRDYLLDHEDRCTIRDFLNCSKNKADTWLAYCSYPNDNWVGKKHKDWSDIDWHSFAVAVINSSTKGGGKIIIFWDCDLKKGIDLQSDRPAKTLFSFAFALLMEIYKKGLTVSQIWVNRDPHYDGLEKCLKTSLRWITWAAQFGDIKFQGADDDDRIVGCECLKHIK